MINPDFWKGKKVLITGHSGFKGSWLSLWLTDMGAQVFGYSLAPETSPSLFELTSLEKKINSRIGDIRDLPALKKTILEAEPEIVFHLAAQPIVLRSYRNPLETYSVNVTGTVNLLEAVRHSRSVRTVLNVTTDKVYENKEWDWSYRENDSLGGFDPYSNSKACSELVTASYRSTYFPKTKLGESHQVRIHTARAGNVIGGGDWAEGRLIPDIIRCHTNKSELEIRYPKAIRPWQHVLESLAGYLKLAQYSYSAENDYLESWNFGPGTDELVRVEDILNFISTIPELHLKYRIEAGEFHEALNLRLDNSRALEFLDWKSRWNARQAIKLTLDWYQQYLSGEDPYKLCRKHIKEYQKCL